MKTERRKIAELKLDPNNANTHPEKNIEAIKGSLKKFGQQKPIVIDQSNTVDFVGSSSKVLLTANSGDKTIEEVLKMRGKKGV